jgi:hypothetical protein
MLGFLTTDTIDPESPLALVLLMMSSSAIFVMGLIPLSIAFAIQRYRLWDVDIIIRRTLLYGALSANLGLVYLGMVVVLQWFLAALTGDSRKGRDRNNHIGHRSPVHTAEEAYST